MPLVSPPLSLWCPRIITPDLVRRIFLWLPPLEILELQQHAWFLKLYEKYYGDGNYAPNHRRYDGTRKGFLYRMAFSCAQCDRPWLSNHADGTRLFMIECYYNACVLVVYKVGHRAAYACFANYRYVLSNIYSTVSHTNNEVVCDYMKETGPDADTLLENLGISQQKLDKVGGYENFTAIYGSLVKAHNHFQKFINSRGSTSREFDYVNNKHRYYTHYDRNNVPNRVYRTYTYHKTDHIMGTYWCFITGADYPENIYHVDGHRLYGCHLPGIGRGDIIDCIHQLLTCSINARYDDHLCCDLEALDCKYEKNKVLAMEAPQ